MSYSTHELVGGKSRSWSAPEVAAHIDPVCLVSGHARRGSVTGASRASGISVAYLATDRELGAIRDLQWHARRRPEAGRDLPLTRVPRDRQSCPARRGPSAVRPTPAANRAGTDRAQPDRRRDASRVPRPPVAASSGSTVRTRANTSLPASTPRSPCAAMNAPTSGAEPAETPSRLYVRAGGLCRRRSPKRVSRRAQRHKRRCCGAALPGGVFVPARAGRIS